MRAALALRARIRWAPSDRLGTRAMTHLYQVVSRRVIATRSSLSLLILNGCASCGGLCVTEWGRTIEGDCQLISVSAGRP